MPWLRFSTGDQKRHVCMAVDGSETLQIMGYPDIYHINWCRIALPSTVCSTRSREQMFFFQDVENHQTGHFLQDTSMTAGEVAMAIAAVAAMRDVTMAIAMAIAIATRLAIRVATTVATGVVAISRMAMKGIPMHKVCHVPSIHSRIPSIIPTEDGTLGAAVMFLGFGPQGEPVFHTCIAMKRFIT